MNSKQAYVLASKMDGVTIKKHFGSDGFSANKRMFLTIWHEKNQANIRLNISDQEEFLAMDGDGFAPINNAWGRQGWTTINLEFVERADFQKALRKALEFSASPDKASKSSQTKRKAK